MENEKALEILVVEDSPKHIESAKQLLGDYSLTIVSTYKEAAEKIRERIGKRMYDVLLTDLFFPWYTECKYPLTQHTAEITTPQALGYPLAMNALMLGIKRIGIVTDANHHTGAMAATTDEFIGGGLSQRRIVRDEDKSIWMFGLGGSDTGEDYTRPYTTEDGSKDWKRALEVLIGTK